MLSSSIDALLKVSKTTSDQKLFDYDCVTLYILMDIDSGYITLCPLFLNQLTQICMPRQENFSLFPCDIAKLLPSEIL